VLCASTFLRLPALVPHVDVHGALCRIDVGLHRQLAGSTRDDAWDPANVSSFTDKLPSCVSSQRFWWCIVLDPRFRVVWPHSGGRDESRRSIRGLAMGCVQHLLLCSLRCVSTSQLRFGFAHAGLYCREGVVDALKSNTTTTLCDKYDFVVKAFSDLSADESCAWFDLWYGFERTLRLCDISCLAITWCHCNSPGSRLGSRNSQEAWLRRITWGK